MRDRIRTRTEAPLGGVVVQQLKGSPRPTTLTRPSTRSGAGARSRVPGDVVPLVVSGPLLAGTFLALVYLEVRYPLRRSVEPKVRHVARNLALATFTAAAVRLAEMPAGLPMARRGGGRGGGGLPLGAPPRRRRPLVCPCSVWD